VSKLTLPIKWHGGKHYLAPKIVALMPPHLHYVEPFFGGGSVMLAAEPEGRSEVANDIDFHLTNFWRVLQDSIRFDSFLRLCEATPFSESEYRTAGLQYHDPCDDQVKSAWQFFIRCRQSLAGRMKCFAPLSKTRVRRGMNEQASAWLTAIEGLAEVHERLKRVVVLNRDAIDVIGEQDGVQTLFYCDPPYLHETRKSIDVYAHEMTEADHAKFLDTINHTVGKVMISGYRSRLYDHCLSGWTRHDFDLPNNSAGGETKRRMTECLWCNF
jgi:DNA adenine methylase